MPLRREKTNRHNHDSHMHSCRLSFSRECPKALPHLYELYRASLPPCKQAFVAPHMPADLLAKDGLVCFQDDEPIAALLWRLDREMPFSLSSVDFYAESPVASFESIQLLFDAFLARNCANQVIHFELWTPPQARIHQVLLQRGFERIERKLLSLSQPALDASEFDDIHLVSLSEFHLIPTRLAKLGEVLCQAYAETVDGRFYEHYRTPASCRAYLSQVVNSPWCNTRHSWLACSAHANTIIGAALCHSWPRARTLFLEQLFIDPQHRGRGVGKRLFSQVTRALAQGGVRNLVWTVSEANHPALALYQSFGAAELDAEIAYIKTVAKAIVPAPLGVSP